MRILIALDGSASSDAATSTVVAQMKTDDVIVRLLHVLDAFPARLAEAEGSRAYPDFAAARLEERRAAERLLADTAAKLRSAGFRVETTVQEGDPRGAILDEAAAWNADLIVVGSHGRTGLQRVLMGSVSEAVVRHAPCSVEVVRSRGPR